MNTLTRENTGNFGGWFIDIIPLLHAWNVKGGMRKNVDENVFESNVIRLIHWSFVILDRTDIRCIWKYYIYLEFESKKWWEHWWNVFEIRLIHWSFVILDRTDIHCIWKYYISRIWIEEVIESMRILMKCLRDSINSLIICDF